VFGGPAVVIGQHATWAAWSDAWLPPWLCGGTFPVVFVFDSGPKPPEGTSASQVGRMLEALSDTVKLDATRSGSLIHRVE